MFFILQLLAPQPNSKVVTQSFQLHIRNQLLDAIEELRLRRVSEFILYLLSLYWLYVVGVHFKVAFWLL